MTVKARTPSRRCPVTDSSGPVFAGRRRVFARVLGPLPQALELLLELRDLGVWQLLEREEAVARIGRGPDELVELQMDSGGVPVLRRLNEEDHQKCDDCRP